MAESSSDSEPEDFILYQDREEWKDVVPVAQDDGPVAIVAIAYSEQCMLLLYDNNNNVIVVA